MVGERRRLRQIERQIERIKEQLLVQGPLRPGALTRQYKNPQQRRGAYHQLNYTRKMKSHTEYVRPEFIADIRKQIIAYKRFKKLVEKWIALGIEHSQLTMRLAKSKGKK